MKLIYMYIGKLNDIFKDFEICFDRDYKVKINEGKIEIKTKEKTTKCYYGSNLNYSKLILGKNGSGKSTLLKLIGLKYIDLKFMYDEDLDYFIKIFEISKNSYYVEGFGNNLNNLLTYNVEYTKSSFYERNFVCQNDILIEDFDTPIIKSEFFSIAPKLIYKRYTESDSINMIYIGKDSILEVYNFVNSKIFDKIDNFYNKNIKIEFTNINRQVMNNIDLYNGLLKLITDVNTDTLKFEKKIHIFLISLLEGYICNLLRQLENVKNDKIFSFKSDMDDSKIKSIESNYEKRKFFLLDQIETISKQYKNCISDFEIKIIKELIAKFELLQKIDFGSKKNFAVQFTIELKMNENNFDKEIIEELLKFISINNKNILNEYNIVDDFISWDYYKISSGEESLISLMSNFHYALSISNDNPTVLLDEIDNTMNLEFIRKFISTLVNFLAVQEKTISIICTTHSPLLCTDFLKKDIFRLDVDNDGLRCVKQVDYGVLSNINDVINDNFFLKIPYGEYSMKQLNEYRKLIKSLKPDQIDQISEIRGYIDCIDNDVIRKVLNIELENKL